jgi:carbonic anhydrase
MELANFEDRWIYKGSVTTPPCDKFVYWNVLRRIHPIKIDQLAMFKEKLRLNEAQIGNSQNNRAIMPINDHGVLYVNAIYF